MFFGTVVIMLIDLDHNIQGAQRDTLNFFRDQVPFAMTRAINDTMMDVQRHLRGTTLPAAWTTRNKALPRAMTSIIPDSQGRPGMMNARSRKFEVVIGPARNTRGYLAGEGFADRNVSGATKTPKGSAVAIPKVDKGLRRNATGSIPNRLRPRNNPKLFKKDNALFERQKIGGKKTIVKRYTLAPQAKGTIRLRRFYPDANMVVSRVFSGHFDHRFDQAIRTSRFFLGRG